MTYIIISQFLLVNAFVLGLFVYDGRYKHSCLKNHYFFGLITRKCHKNSMSPDIYPELVTIFTNKFFFLHIHPLIIFNSQMQALIWCPDIHMYIEMCCQARLLKYRQSLSMLTGQRESFHL